MTQPPTVPQLRSRHHLEGLIKRALMEGVNIDKHNIKQTRLTPTYERMQCVDPSLTTI